MSEGPKVEGSMGLFLLLAVLLALAMAGYYLFGSN